MSIAIPGVTDWRQFEDYARRYFSQLWSVDLQARTVDVARQVPWRFDLVGPDERFVGDAKWLKNIAASTRRHAERSLVNRLGRSSALSVTYPRSHRRATPLLPECRGD